MVSIIIQTHVFRMLIQIAFLTPKKGLKCRWGTTEMSQKRVAFSHIPIPDRQQKKRSECVVFKCYILDPWIWKS